jgi:phosphoglycerol transferase MdoB-like AlkP superfamily enzyme
VFAVYFAALLLAITFFDTSLLARSRDRVANELAINGPSSFFRALRTSEIEYHPWYVTRPTRDNVARLEQQLSAGPGTLRRDANGWLVRDVPANPQGLGKLNVVILASESFGAEFSKLYGSDRDWTPAFDRLAQGGLWFRQMYASGNRTVRGLEAITSSIPPIPTVSILHRPGSDNIANWGAIMRANGYHTTFFYGGYGSFDDMNRFYASNGFEVVDRLQIPGPTRFENIWGVSDEDLFDTALRHFDGLNSQGKRFFAIVMNTSNHKPFTFREGVPGVKAEGGGRESGVRYADFAKNYFIESARTKPWFDDTLFIIVADHGARVYGRAEIPIGSYRIPMLFYSPRHLKPGVHESLTTQIDIAPTALGLLGIGYSAPFFGQDVLNTPPEGHVAFFSHNHNAALMRYNQMTILGLRKTLKNESYDPTTGEYGPGTPDPDRDALTVAYYQTAYEMFRAHQFVTPPQPVAIPP